MVRRSRLVTVTALAVALLGVTGVLVAAHAEGSSGTKRVTQAVPLTPIKHVVFIYRENHSFDNIFAPYCVNARHGACDGHVGRVPWAGTHVVTTRPASDIVPGVCHTVRCQNLVVNGGRMDGWDQLIDCKPFTGYACLQQFQPKQIRILTTIADHGVLADRFFSEPDPSAGSHLFFMTGEDTLGFTGDSPDVTPDGYTPRDGWGCDSNKQGDWIDPATGAMSKQWFCNPNATWLPFGGAPGSTPVTGKPDFFTSILDAHGVSWLNYGEDQQRSVYQWNLPPFQAAALANDRQKMVKEYKAINDAATGRLPQVSFVTPSHDAPHDSTSQHNTQSMAAGDNFITKLLAAIQAGPDATSTAVLITWDDCGCFYDHVRPPAGLGIRVPLLIWSPWARQGYVDHQQGQFSSVLAFIERVFGLPSLTSLNPEAMDGRVTNDLMNDFDFGVSLATVKRRVAELQLPAETVLPAWEKRWLSVHGHDEDNDDT